MHRIFSIFVTDRPSVHQSFLNLFFSQNWFSLFTISQWSMAEYKLSMNLYNLLYVHDNWPSQHLNLFSVNNYIYNPNSQPKIYKHSPGSSSNESATMSTSTSLFDSRVPINHHFWTGQRKHNRIPSGFLLKSRLVYFSVHPQSIPVTSFLVPGLVVLLRCIIDRYMKQRTSFSRRMDWGISENTAYVICFFAYTSQ